MFGLKTDASADKCSSIKLQQVLASRLQAYNQMSAESNRITPPTQQQSP